jgi:hypothetical protein
MNFLPNGKIMFNDIFELDYHLFMEMGFSINKDDYLYDQETGAIITFSDKQVKASVDPKHIVYAGKNDIVFSPTDNYTFVNRLFGYFLDKISNDPESDIKYIAHAIEDNAERDKQRLMIRTVDGDYFTEYYWTQHLMYIEAIFILGHNFNVDLSNFDVARFTK